MLQLMPGLQHGLIHPREWISRNPATASQLNAFLNFKLSTSKPELRPRPSRKTALGSVMIDAPRRNLVVSADFAW